MWPYELAILVGLESDASTIPQQADESLLPSFWAALGEGEYSHVETNLRSVLTAWQDLGGEIRVDTSDEEVGAYLCWKGVSPWVVYPESGYVELQFHRLKSLPPFDDLTLRERFRVACNEMAGVRIPAVKVDFWPWSSLEVFESEKATEAAQRALGLWRRHSHDGGRTAAPSGTAPRSTPQMGRGGHAATTRVSVVTPCLAHHAAAVWGALRGAARSY